MSNSFAQARDLTANEIEAYQRDGVVCLRGAYDQQCLDMLAEVLDEFWENNNDHIPGVSSSVKQTLYHWFVNDTVRDFVLYGPGARIAQQVMRSKRINFFYDQIFIKSPGAPDPTPWHHDITFWPTAGDQIGTIWASLDPVSAETSALEFVAGSHKWGKRYKPVALGGTVISEERLDAVPDIEADRSKYTILSWDLEPGDALFFHSHTLHGARGNKSLERPRRAIATRWCGDDAVYKKIEGLAPLPRDPGLEDGEPLSGLMFPQILPVLDEKSVAPRFRGPVHPDPKLVAAAMKQIARAEKVPVS